VRGARQPATECLTSCFGKPRRASLAGRDPDLRLRTATPRISRFWPRSSTAHYRSIERVGFTQAGEVTEYPRVGRSHTGLRPQTYLMKREGRRRISVPRAEGMVARVAGITADRVSVGRLMRSSNAGAPRQQTAPCRLTGRECPCHDVPVMAMMLPQGTVSEAWQVRGSRLAIILENMGHTATNNRSNSFFSGFLNRLSVRVAPLVRDELAAELRQLFEERLRSEVGERVEAIMGRELQSNKRLQWRLEYPAGTIDNPDVQTPRRNGAAPGVTAEDITACIELMLGRTPEPELVEYHLKLGFHNRFALGEYVLGSAEFESRYASRIGHDAESLLDRPPPGGARRPAAMFLGDRVLAFTHRGHIIYLVPSDIGLTPSVLLHGGWEPHVEQTIVNSLRPGATVIDIGANVGYHTLRMAEAVGTTGQVHAFEANPEVMRLLRATMFVNGFSSWLGDGRVCLHECAVLDKPGTIVLASSPGFSGSGHVVIDDMPSSDYGPAYSTRVEVAAVTLDAELADRIETVDLIHMDIEGSEPLALHGARGMIARSPQIKIITEWIMRMMQTRADIPEYVAWLAGLGFRFWRIDAGPNLTELDRVSVLTAADCDLLLSRQEPSGQR
jgi:FkbM family methyltransferase